MNQLSNIEMNKLMHYFFIGFEYKLNVEKKKLLLDIFKRKSCVKIKDMKNYVEVSTFEKSISHRKKDSEFYEEIKKLKTDELNSMSKTCAMAMQYNGFYKNGEIKKSQLKFLYERSETKQEEKTISDSIKSVKKKRSEKKNNNDDNVITIDDLNVRF